jgi:hypothetical protein
MSRRLAIGFVVGVAAVIVLVLVAVGDLFALLSIGLVAAFALLVLLAVRDTGRRWLSVPARIAFALVAGVIVLLTLVTLSDPLGIVAFVLYVPAALLVLVLIVVVDRAIRAVCEVFRHMSRHPPA